jgi:hypothetical protein
MSLHNIQLPPLTIGQLYKKVLVEPAPVHHTPTAAKEDGFTVLGKNNKNITIVVEDTANLYLPEATLNFLMGILSACGLTMEDVALLNIDKNNNCTYQNIQSRLQAQVVLLFGISPEAIELPLSFPHYQVQRYNKQVYLSAPDLGKLLNNKPEKIKLWNSLKQIFSA